MIYQEDWIMRQIKAMVQMVAKAFFRKNTVRYEIVDETNLKEADLLHLKLRGLLREGNVNEAENVLFDRIQPNNPDFLRLALDFYSRVNEMTNADLEKANFSREEIKEGLASIAKIYGMGFLGDDLFRT